MSDEPWEVLRSWRKFSLQSDPGFRCVTFSAMDR
jgi:hypothetical protein